MFQAYENEDTVITVISAFQPAACFLFRYDATDYKNKGPKKAGYATNPRYPDILIKTFEQYDFQKYTIKGMNAPGPDVAKLK
jgi:hypothetical protein